jgi:tRNA (mo5U34)-methyltransferase
MPTLAESPDVRRVAVWRHQIQLPDGSVTPGTQDTAAQLAVLGLPNDLTGLTVLDIGCSDGFFAFECERRGAKRVVGFDNYSSPYVGAAHGFEVARQILGSRVELIIGDLTKDLEQLESFDLVLFLGVLYHLKDPFGGLERVASVCRGQVIVETAITRPFTGWKWSALRRMFPDVLTDRHMVFLGPEINLDPSTWWAQSADCVTAMMRASGFCDVRAVDITWSRGIFHGFGPSRGTDVADVLSKFDDATVRSAIEMVCGDGSRDPRTLSIKQFGAFKQAAAELAARRQFLESRTNLLPRT